MKPDSKRVGQDLGRLLEADQHERLRVAADDALDLGAEVVGVRVVRERVDDLAALLLERLARVAEQTFTVGVLERDERCVGDAFLDHEVGEHPALQHVGRSGTEVQVVVVVRR